MSSNQQIESLSYNDIWDKKIEAIHYIHLAGKAHVFKKTSDESEYFKVNYELTKRLYDRFLEDQNVSFPIVRPV